MNEKIIKHINEAVQSLYRIEDNDFKIQIEPTKKGIDGDYTLVVFPLAKFSKKSPQDTAKEIGVYIKSRFEELSSYNVVNGFLNLKMTSEFWINTLNSLVSSDFNNLFEDRKETVMIEFSSPNTNKPQHLGHIRNNLIGESVSRILKAYGYNTIKVNLINDRGIHICKTILSWMKWGENKEPKSEGLKGDTFVGNFYVKFENEYRKQVQELIEQGTDPKEAENTAPLMLEAREILRKWEAGDHEIMQIWKMMNEWVYNGFDQTYKSLGISFDKYYYESETYLLGKELVNSGLEKDIFYKNQDSSVWIRFDKPDLEDKLLLRSDGTTVYMTQDLGTVFSRANEFNPDKIIYVVGNEQNYHFKLLKEIVSCFDPDVANKIEHLSYGMVELPEGKMKSREGKVVDADELIVEMINSARNISQEHGRIKELPEDQRENIIRIIALGALKYFILKIDPKKNMMFNPAESIDFNGNTGPFIQYTHARICSVLRNAERMKIKFTGKNSGEARLVDKEINLIAHLANYKGIVENAAKTYDSGLIANYLFELVKEFNQYYHDHSILKERDAKIMQFRLSLSLQVANTIKAGMYLLGSEVPEIM